MFPYKISDILDQYAIRAKKSLSQNFICDENILRRIVACAQLPAGCAVWEIGPGPAGLSMALLEQPIGHLTMVEFDQRFAPLYQKLAGIYPNRLTSIFGDGLAIHPQNNVHLVANIPYQITSDILLWAVQNQQNIASFTLLVQDEVAQRITAKPHSKEYGRLSIITQSFYDITSPYFVPARVFVPPPKVDSMVIHGQRRDNINDIDPQILGEITRIAFQFRRKTLRNNFKQYPHILEESGLDPNARPEEIAVADYIKMAKLWQDNYKK